MVAPCGVVQVVRESRHPRLECVLASKAKVLEMRATYASAMVSLLAPSLQGYDAPSIDASLLDNVMAANTLPTSSNHI